jgi:hypothetical protein
MRHPPVFWLIFRLFVEAQESWDYAITDKIVHFGKVRDVDVNSVSIASEIDDRMNSMWLQVNLCLQGQWEPGYKAIIYRFDGMSNDRRRKIELEPTGMQRDISMLVDIPKCMQFTKKGFFGELRVVGLKRFDDSDSVSGHPAVQCEILLGVSPKTNLAMMGKVWSLVALPPCKLTKP